MSAPEDFTSPAAATAPAGRKGRRRFLKQAGAVVAAAPVVAALQAAEAATTSTSKKKATSAKPKPAPAPDPFSATHPDLTLFRTPEEREMLETQWKAMQGALDAIRKAPLYPGTEPVTVFAAMPRTRAKES